MMSQQNKAQKQWKEAQKMVLQFTQKETRDLSKCCGVTHFKSPPPPLQGECVGIAFSIPHPNKPTRHLRPQFEAASSGQVSGSPQLDPFLGVLQGTPQCRTCGRLRMIPLLHRNIKIKTPR